MTAYLGLARNHELRNTEFPNAIKVTSGSGIRTSELFGDGRIIHHHQSTVQSGVD